MCVLCALTMFFIYTTLTYMFVLSVDPPFRYSGAEEAGCWRRSVHLGGDGGWDQCAA